MIANDNDLRKDPNFIFNLERNIKKTLLLLVAMLSILLMLALIIILILMPLKEKEPYLVFFSNADNNFVRVVQGNYNIRADTALLKSIISGYVIDRETINRISDEERYRKIASQSENKVWKTFERLVTQQGSIYTTPNLYREVEIINTTILSKNVALVDFIAITQQGVVKNISRFRVSIQYDFKDMEITHESAPNNPTGFIVKEYQTTKINIENQNTTQEEQKTPLKNNQADEQANESIFNKKD